MRLAFIPGMGKVCVARGLLGACCVGAAGGGGGKLPTLVVGAALLP